MRKYLLSFFLCCIVGFCCAQETVERTARPDYNMEEKFSVLKSNKKIKQGLFQAYYDGALVAIGNYNNGKKVGVWRYNDNKGVINQHFNYATNTAKSYGAVPDTNYISYGFDVPVSPKDTLTYPVKAGGYFYGYFNFENGQLDEFKHDRSVGLGNGKYLCMYIFSIGADGLLSNLKLYVSSGDFKKIYDSPLNKLSDDDKVFAAATQNGKPIPSKLYLKFFIESGFH